MVLASPLLLLKLPEISWNLAMVLLLVGGGDDVDGWCWRERCRVNAKEEGWWSISSSSSVEFRLRLAIFVDGGMSTRVDGLITELSSPVVAGSNDSGCFSSSSGEEFVYVSVVMSNRLDLRRRLLLLLFRRRKYFWAWLATWVGVRVLTKFLEIPLQSPFPTLFNPTRNSRCSSSVHGTPLFRSWQRAEGWMTSSEA